MSEALRPIRRGGFTLVEILLTVIIGSLIAVTAMATYQTVAGVRQKIIARNNRCADLRYAGDRIRNDLANLYRSPNPAEMSMEGIREPVEHASLSRLCFLAVFDPPATDDSDRGEGDLYYVEYLAYDRSETKHSSLIRRLRPAKPGSFLPAEQATELIGSFETFRCEYYAEGQWQDRWPASRGIPDKVRITLVTVTTGGDEASPELFSQIIGLKPFTQSPLQHRAETLPLAIPKE